MSGGASGRPAAGPAPLPMIPGPCRHSSNKVGALPLWAPALICSNAFPTPACIDLGGRLVTPGLIDCHTHLIYAGDRSAEMERRLAGESYQAIARSGGGILSTVAATAAATVAELVQLSLPRLDATAGRGRDQHRNQIGLWPGIGRGNSHVAGGTRLGRTAADQRVKHLFGCSCPANGICWQCSRLR